MTINQLSIFVENKPGAMCSMTKILAENDINMRALSLAETEDFGIVRIIVDNVYKATTVLKDEGYVHSLTPVLGVAIPNAPGGLNKVLEILSDAGSNVEYMYAFLGSNNTNQAYMIFKVGDVTAASEALAAQGIKTVGQDELAKL